MDGTTIRVDERFVLESTSGPIDHVKGWCEDGHPYCGPVFYVAEEKS